MPGSSGVGCRSRSCALVSASGAEVGRCAAGRQRQTGRHGLWRCREEHIQLNEDTIWNGKKRDRINPEALKALPEVRRLLFEGKPREAEALEDQKMMGIPNRQPPYQPLGDLNIDFSGQDDAVDYRRELNLATGIVRVTYRVGDATFTREVFSSAPDQVLVVRILRVQAGPSVISCNA